MALGVYGMPVGTMLVVGRLRRGLRTVPDRLDCLLGDRAVPASRSTPGNFEIIKDSVGGLTDDRRLQALLIAFALGAFIEGAAGFGTPVAVAAAMLTGLGFSPFYAAGICLIANTAPVAFGSIGIPIVTLAGITGFRSDAAERRGSAGICAPVSLFIPAYLMMVMGGWRALEGRAAGRHPVRRLLRRHAVLRVQLRRPGAHRYPERAGRHRRAGRAVQGLEARRQLHLEGDHGEAKRLQTTARRARCWPGPRICSWCSSCCCGAIRRSRRSSTS